MPCADAPVPLRRKARHHDVPSGQGAASGEAPEVRALLPSQGQGLRALPAQGRLPFKAEPMQDCRHRRRLSGAVARPSAEASKVRRGSAALPAPILAIRGLPGEAKTRHGLRRAVRPRKNEDPILPDGRRDQPEASRGRFRRAIACLRHESGARNACFRLLDAVGGMDSLHARRIRLTLPDGLPTEWCPREPARKSQRAGLFNGFKCLSKKNFEVRTLRMVSGLGLPFALSAR